jgi:hypothetical protein
MMPSSWASNGPEAEHKDGTGTAAAVPLVEDGVDGILDTVADHLVAREDGGHS